MTIDATIDRKEIAYILRVNVRTVVRKERAWGLDRMRCPPKTRCVLYSRGQVLNVFESWGWITKS